MVEHRITSDPKLRTDQVFRLSPQQQTPTFTDLPSQTGVGRNFINQFDKETLAGFAAIRATNTGSGSAASRQAAQNRLKFGLAGFDLSREELALQRKGLGLSQEELGLNRRNALEGVINNALQRGIFRSGIRIRNEERVNERADLDEARLDLRSQGFDITGRRLDLSEKELRANIKNALAGLKSSAANQKRQAEIDFEQARRNIRDQMILEQGGIFPSVGTEVIRDAREGGVR